MTGFLFCWLMLGVILHVALMGFETLPPSSPLLLRLVSKRKLKSLAEELALPQTPVTAGTFTPTQQTLVSNIVKNAGIYNGIVAAVLFAAAYTGDRDVVRVLLAGITVAGAFGGMTLSPGAWAQAVFGAVGLAAFYYP